MDLPPNKLPGFGLPRRDGFSKMAEDGWDRTEDGQLRFPFLLDDNGEVGGLVVHGLTLREIRMLGFVNAITDKPAWERKVFDEAIVAKWRAEAKVDEVMPEGGRGEEDVFMSAPMFDYCIAQLRDKAKTFEETGMVSVLDAELAVVKSDSAVSDALRDDLRRAVAVLEDVPDHQKDWHPDSDQQVLDLLHPSLYPVVFGRTRVLPRGTVPLDDCVQYTGQGVVAAIDEDELNAATETDDPNNPFESMPCVGLDKFQWLPAEVTLRRPADDATTGPVTASITSYINNLHPRTHRALYAVLERCVAAAVPLWETCLSSFADRRAIKLTATDDEQDYYIPDGVVYPFIPRPVPGDPDFRVEYNDDGSPKYGYHGDGTGDADSTGVPGPDEDEDYEYDDDVRDDWRRQHCVLRWPEPKPYPAWAAAPSPSSPSSSSSSSSPSPLPEGWPARPDHFCLTDTAAFPDGVQIIFKLATIHLTPDRPAYAGGAWHIEGTLAERICASALYYYDEDNIGETALRFRTALDADHWTMVPAQHAFRSLMAYMGIRDPDNTPAEQDLGAVRTRPGRLLAFPNVLQHRVEPFALADPARPGHRKLLALFLVEPRRRILSSAHVPPQRRDRWAAQVAHDVPALAHLPPELFAQTVAAVDDFPIDWATACQDRLDLMAARRTRVDEVNGSMMRNAFSFCEH